MGALLQRLLHFVSPDAESHQHLYATMGCCSDIRIVEEDHAENPPCGKEHDPEYLGRLQAADVGQPQQLRDQFA